MKALTNNQRHNEVSNEAIGTIVKLLAVGFIVVMTITAFTSNF